MLIRRADLDRIASGEVTLAFRRWRRPTVKAGGTLPCARLARMDATSPHGPWTAATLRAIDTRPGTVSTVIAADLSFDRTWLKTQIRKLKALGLTESLEVGYRLSPRGVTLMKALR